MGTTPWSNDQPRDLIVPGGAGPNDTRIVIGPDVPGIITFYYTDTIGAVLADAWIGEYIDANHFHYEVWGTNGVINFHATGWVDLTQVGDEVHQDEIDFLNGPPFALVTRYDFDKPGQRLFFNSQVKFGEGPGNTDYPSDVGWQGGSYERGTIIYLSSTANSAAIGTTETFVLSQTATFPQGRAFSCEFGWGWQASAIGVRATIRLRETSATGLILCEFGITPEAQTANLPYGFGGTSYFKNTSGADVTVAVGLGMFAGGAAGTVLQPGAVGRPRWLRIIDVGAASIVPTAVSLT